MPVRIVVESKAERSSSMMAADTGGSVLGIGQAKRCYAAFAFSASRIARQTFSGVSGMLISLMPYSESASMTALTITHKLPAQPASPQPLVPSGLVLAGEG